MRHLRVAPVLLVLGLLTSSTSARATDTPQYTSSWGEFGIAPGQFNKIAGIAVDPAGNVYVADSNQRRIQKFGPNGDYLLEWPLAQAELQHPVGLAADTHGHLFVTDYYGHQVLRYDLQGTLQISFGSEGSDPGEFAYPTDVDVETDGNVLVVDQLNDRLQRFTAEGQFLAVIRDSAGPGAFDHPFGVATDPFGNIYVSDAGHFAIKKFDHEGHFLTQWGSEGTGDGQFLEPGGPTGIALDRDHTVYVVDSWGARVEMFSDNGSFVGQFGMAGSTPGTFTFPINIAVSSLYEIYVGDVNRYQVDKFTAHTTPVVFTTWGRLKNRYR